MMTETTAQEVAPATIDDLYRIRKKAELVGGKIVMMRPAGYQHGRCATRILVSLHSHAEKTGHGEAFSDNLGYQIPTLPNAKRQSFSPDASYYVGPLPDDPTKFVEGPPTFAVEVRSPDEYGPAAERQMAAKRADYFAAGTLVVWDVDLKNHQVFVFRSSDQENPAVFTGGQIADAAPAVPGWLMPIDDVFA